MPQKLEPGVLYLSEEFETAAHLCACGCGSKIRTPLGPTEWRVANSLLGPTLRPSVGNWQQPCRSHYLITRGEIQWAGQWTDEEILSGRLNEDRRRKKYFDARNKQSTRAKKGFWNWIKRIFS